MAEVEIPTKADAIALLARRLRQHYGDRLRQLFLLKDDPYEPSGEDFAIYLVAVLADDAYDRFETIGEVARIGNQVDAEMDYTVASAIYPLSVSDFEDADRWTARAAREEGVVL